MNAHRQLLADINEALSVPFADPVTVHGIIMSRDLARAMERGLLRDLQFSKPTRRPLGDVASASRIEPSLPSPAGAHVSPFHGDLTAKKNGYNHA